MSQDWTTGRISALGHTLAWRGFGQSSGTPLLLIHGGLRGKSTSSKPYELLSPLGEDRRLVSWDQLACGASDSPDDVSALSLSYYAEEIEVVRNQLVPGPLHLFAASLGSTFAIEWLLTHRPAEVLSVALMCPIIDGERAQASMRAAQRLAGPNFPRQFITRHPPLGGAADGPPHPQINVALSSELARWKRTDELSRLKMPVIFIRGEHDYITAEDMEFYARHCPGAKTATIKDAAHLAFIDAPGATCAIMRSFLRDSKRK